MNKGYGFFRAAGKNFALAPQRRFASIGSPYFQNLLPSPLYIRPAATLAKIPSLPTISRPQLRYYSAEEEDAHSSNPENLPGESKPLALVIEDEIQELRDLALQTSEYNHIEEYVKEKNWKIVKAPESMVELSTSVGDITCRVVFQALPVEDENPYDDESQEDPNQVPGERDTDEGDMQSEGDEEQGPPRRQYEHPFTVELSRPGRRTRVVLRCVATEEDFFVSEIMNARNDKALPLMAETDLSEQLQEGIYEQLATVGIDNRIGQLIIEQVNKNFQSQKMEVLEQMRSFFK